MFPFFAAEHVWCMQDLYSEDRRVWNAMFEMVSLDLASAERDGVASPQGKFWPIVIANKGDWSYLEPHLKYICIDFWFSI